MIGWYRRILWLSPLSQNGHFLADTVPFRQKSHDEYVWGKPIEMVVSKKKRPKKRYMKVLLTRKCFRKFPIRGGPDDTWEVLYFFSPEQFFFFLLLTRNKPLLPLRQRNKQIFFPIQLHFSASFVNKLFILYSLLNKLIFHHFLLNNL